jgi:hypothetical protein
VEVLADSSATVGGITGAVWGRHQGFRVACLGIDKFNPASVVFPEITTSVKALKFV